MNREELPGPDPVPPIPTLGPAQTHRAVAESAALHHDFSTALRERFRAVVRGMEQGGLLEVRRSRTARETADLAAATAAAIELPEAARSFDEVVYGGRPAGEAEYRLLEQADRYSLAPPPPDEPVETPTGERRAPGWRMPPLPDLLRDRRFWAVVVGALLIALIVYLLLHLSGAPEAPPAPPRLPPSPGEPPPLPPPTITGSDSIFGRLPHWLAFGGLQWLVCAAIVVWWRARRRGTLVGEPRPVQVAANEVLAGQAALYRKSKDHNHIAAKLRTATLRRIRPVLNLTADAPPEWVIAAIAARTGGGIGGTATGGGIGGTAAGADPNRLGATLFGPAADDAALEMYAAELDRIEREIG